MIFTSLLAECCGPSYIYQEQQLFYVPAGNSITSGRDWKDQWALHSPSLEPWSNTNPRYQFIHILAYSPNTSQHEEGGEGGNKVDEGIRQREGCEGCEERHITRVQDQHDAVFQVGIPKGEARIDQENRKPTRTFYKPNQTVHHQEHEGRDRGERVGS